jgi:hypothetical protein
MFQGGINIGKSLAKRIKNKEAFWMFRAQLKQLYLEFEAQVEALCQRTSVELEEWYSPSYIPQPKFVFNSIALDADMLYDEEEFHLLFAPKIPWRTRQDTSGQGTSLADLLIKNGKKHEIGT